MRKCSNIYLFLSNILYNQKYILTIPKMDMDTVFSAITLLISKKNGFCASVLMLNRFYEQLLTCNSYIIELPFSVFVNLSLCLSIRWKVATAITVYSSARIYQRNIITNISFERTEEQLGRTKLFEGVGKMEQIIKIRS